MKDFVCYVYFDFCCKLYLNKGDLEMLKKSFNYFALGLLLFAFFSVVGSLSFAGTVFAEDINADLTSQANIGQNQIEQGVADCTDCHFNTLSSNMSKNMQVNEDISILVDEDDAVKESNLVKPENENIIKDDNNSTNEATIEPNVNLQKEVGEAIKPNISSQNVTTLPIKSSTAKATALNALGQITTYGEAKLELAPDRVTLNVCIETIDANKKDSRQKAQDLFNEVVNSLTQLGINKSDIVVTSFYTRENVNCKNLMGFVSNIYFNFETNTNNTTNLISNLLENDGVEVSSVTYSLSDYDKIYSGLLNTAVQNAVAKAGLLSSDNLEIVNIEEENYYYCPTLWRNSVDVLEDNGYIGKVEVSAKVKVTMQAE